MNGVLERVGYDGPYSEVLLRQSQALSECSRCLRPGGVLYIGIENRFGANYLMGAPDEHTGLRYVNVLPRGVANAYSRIARKQEFTAFTHSAGDLNRMLRQSGFGQVRFWSPLPSYREIRLLTPLSGAPVDLVKEAAQIYPHRVPRWVTVVSRAIPHQLWRYLSPHFAVVAAKQDA
jgi:hypothetical protein